MMKLGVRIRYAGKDFEFPNVEDAYNALSTEFKGKSVSLLYSSSSLNMNTVIYVDVKDDGSVYKSYGAREALSMDFLFTDVRV